ncbi:hypothetical protein KJ644_02765 [Candidatus Dependentiae bacterium]|nr:hypothetical protein [Candidatus Dependentiae bacterium]MBU4387371.1 hypothetical protein [Candidatus Dependentiae bacterium]MCG2756573.1 hypothetical protein [Candidatus Dependentiae bacterium]
MNFKYLFIGAIFIFSNVMGIELEKSDSRPITPVENYEIQNLEKQKTEDEIFEKQILEEQDYIKSLRSANPPLN